MTNLKSDVSEFLKNCDSAVTNNFFQFEFNPAWLREAAVKYPDCYKEELGVLSELDSKGIQTEQVDHFGGEGQGDAFWSVYSFEREEEKVYVKFDGWYASYNGSEFTDWSFVEPKEKVITVYEQA